MDSTKPFSSQKRVIELDDAWQEMLAIFAVGGKYNYALTQEDVQGQKYMVISINGVENVYHTYKTQNMKDGKYLIDKIVKGL